MLEFREININDKTWIDNLLAKQKFISCEYNFVNNMAWRRMSDTLIARYKDFYISVSGKGDDIYFTFPAGEGDYREVFLEMQKYAEMKNSNLKIWNCDEFKTDIINNFFAGQFDVVRTPDSYDYIYNSADLINLQGKKYHSKRNHLKRFKNYDYQYFPLSEKDFDECINLSVSGYKDKNMIESHSAVAEQYAIHTCFSYFNELKLMGGVLKVGGKVVAFTIADPITQDVLDIHIEKADTLFHGAYTAINNEFAASSASGFRYINREEDLGLETLRKSKLSYYPAFMAEKNEVIFR